MGSIKRSTTLALTLVLTLTLTPGLASAVGTTSWGVADFANGNAISGVAQLSDEVLVAIADQIIYRSINGGETWTREWGWILPLGDDAWLYDVCFIDDSTGWAVGRYEDGIFYESLILKTTDGGENWVRQDDQAGGLEPALLAVDAADANNALAVGLSGAYYRTTNGGTTWMYSEMAGSPAAQDCAWADSDHFVVVGSNGFILRGTGLGPGFTWDYETDAGLTTNDLNCVDFYPGTDNAVAFGDGSFRISTGDYGNNWSFHNMTPIFSVTDEVHGVQFTDANNGWAVGRRFWNSPSLGPTPYVLRTTDGGSAWSSQSVTDDDSRLYCVGMLDSTEGWAGGSGGALHHMATTTAERLAGDDRYQTAIEISKATFPDGSCDAVVVATGRGFADALSAAGLAGTMGCPLLLAGPGDLPASMVAEIDRVGATEVFIVGGFGAVSEEYGEQLDEWYDVTRLSGADRYDTAAAVATHIGGLFGFSQKAFLARGDAFPDALAVAPFAYSQGIPVLLTRPTALPPSTGGAIAALLIKDVYIAGGTGAVSDDVQDDVDLILAVNGGNDSERWAGADRYQTAVEIAGNGLGEGWGSASYIGVATGLNYPDALAGGVACGVMNGSILLTMKDSLHPHVEQFISDRAQFDTDVRVFGGSGVVSDDVLNAIKTAY